MKEKDNLFWMMTLVAISALVVMFMSAIGSEKKQRESKQMYESIIKSLIKEVNYFSKELEELNPWNNFVDALIVVESGGDSTIVGDNGNSVGVLQIQKIYVDHVNLNGGYSFTYEDRLSREKSIEIFESMQDLKNPCRNIIKALKIHNPNAGDDYYAKVFKEMYGE